MAIKDLRNVDIGSAPWQYDICLIGAGAAGISIAQALAGSRLSVCLLESGGLAQEADTQALYEGELAGHPMTMDVGRYRVLGGSTSEWTGRCGRLDPIDFARRDWVPHSGWPIGLADLEPWYERARNVCGFPDPWIDDACVLKGLDVPPLDDDALKAFVWRYAPLGNRLYRNWGVEYRAVLQNAPNIDVLLHANMTKWHAAPDAGRVEAVTVSTLDGRSARIDARAFVICAGGLESARLLLSSVEDVPGGLGTGLNNAGRFFMQHPRGRIGRLRADAGMALGLQDRHAIFGVCSGIQYETGFALSEKVQREEGLLNASVILTYDADRDSGWEAFKMLAGIAGEDGDHGYGRAGAVRRLLKDPASAAVNLWRRAVQKRHATFPLRGIDLVVDLEQQPDPDSRITLSRERDRLGMRKASVDWRMNDAERRTSARFADILESHFARTGVGQVDKEDWLCASGPIGDELAGTYHHIATLRMSEGPQDGVTDRNGRVHGVDNLYVSSCATFATGGHVNPTYTIVALALRLADHLRERLWQDVPRPIAIQDRTQGEVSCRADDGSPEPPLASPPFVQGNIIPFSSTSHKPCANSANRPKPLLSPSPEGPSSY